MERMTFRLAQMCPVIRAFTLVMLLLPPALAMGAAAGARPLLIPALFLILIYGWVWTRFRPTRFVVRPDAVKVIWPLRRRELPRDQISAVRLLSPQELKEQTGRGVRVGAGGLWGGFGWLWTARRGVVQMYVSRVDGYVWIERGTERPWLITPERPEAFVRALSL
jgi:hypothetical protein